MRKKSADFPLPLHPQVRTRIANREGNTLSLRDPQRNRMLPPCVQTLLNAMFAGAETGMSGPEILGFFRARCNTIDPYPWRMKWTRSRWAIFEDCLAQFPLDRQRAIIQSLIEHQGPMKYGVPRPSDISTGSGVAIE
jgi:hypothetical protein